jgi:putrescine aminotransferase
MLSEPSRKTAPELRTIKNRLGLLTMKFAFLIHPLSEETQQLMEFDPALRASWGQDLLGFCGELHKTILRAQENGESALEDSFRVVDEMTGLVSVKGAEAEGRLYEIPMDAFSFLEKPDRAMQYMEDAVEAAVDWGAEIIGLGSMTGIIGGQGTSLAQHASVPVTTGNSLTVYAAIQNLLHACREVDFDLSTETLAVIGIPGSIAAAAAKLLAPQCSKLVLCARARSAPAEQLAEELGAELLLDIQSALRQARVVFSATSSGNCIAQKWLQSGSVVTDVAVPTDVQGTSAERDDVLFLTGGLSKVPHTMSLDSHYLWFHHGMIPSCLGETAVLALEGHAECYSLGRNLNPQRIAKIGAMAEDHGFTFTRLFSFGLPLNDSTLVGFRKAKARTRAGNVNGKPRRPQPRRTGPPTPEQLAPRAATLHGRHINPVLMALSAKSNFAKIFVKGEGTHLWDSDGNRYLDFVAGFGSLNLGHNHPRVVEAVTTAMTESAPGFAQSAVNPYAAALAERLATLSPPGLEMVFYANGGADAVEAALKLARRATGRRDLLYCDRSYHGKTLGALSVTGNRAYQDPFGPLLDGCRRVPYGDLESLERALADERYAALVVEPLQAEGGMIVPPADYLRGAQQLCRRRGTLLVVDEIQTGFGRTGSMFAVDRLGVEPDVMTLAKSLGGGLMPIGAMLARRDLWMKAYGTFHTFALHTSTFGGGSLACAAGLAALEVLSDEDLATNAAERGRQLLDGLKQLQGEVGVIREIRGEGLLIGVEFEPLPDSIRAHWKEVDASGVSSYLIPDLETLLNTAAAAYVMHTLLDQYGIYTQTTRSNPRVLRVQPPLTISADEIDYFLECITECCGELDVAIRMIDGIIAKSGLGQLSVDVKKDLNNRAARLVGLPQDTSTNLI